MDILQPLLLPRYFPVNPLDGVKQTSTNLSPFTCNQPIFNLSGFVVLAWYIDSLISSMIN